MKKVFRFVLLIVFLVVYLGLIGFCAVNILTGEPPYYETVESAFGGLLLIGLSVLASLIIIGIIIFKENDNE